MRRRLGAALLLCLTALALAGARGDETPDYGWMIFSSLTEPAYQAVREGYTLPPYAGEDVCAPATLALSVGERGDIAFTAPEDGLYELWLEYRLLTNSALPTELSVSLDGAFPFLEARRCKLRGRWADEGVFPLDRYGNEVAATPALIDETLFDGLRDAAARTADPMLFELKAGAHALTLEVTDGAAAISSLTLRAVTRDAPYTPMEALGDSLIVIEAERPAWRNSSDIRGAGEFDASLSPYDARKRKINILDGAGFDAAGDSVTWAFTVTEPGVYSLGARYRQSAKSDFPVFVDVMIDGVVPSEQARRVPFPDCAGYEVMTARDDTGAPQGFKLSAGAHTITFTINCEPLAPVYRDIEDMLREINGLALEVVRLTGGVTTDRHRDYNLTSYIPELEQVLTLWAARCEAMVNAMRPLGEGVAAFANLTLCAAQLRSLAREPEELPRRLKELTGSVTSVSRMLAQQLQDMAICDLTLDQIYLYQKDARLPEPPGLLKSAAAGVERFFHSFGAQDYSVSSLGEDHLQVWMARPRSYVEILQNMIDTRFTPETGIVVDISIMPDASKLVLASAAGNAPDVVLGVQYVLPSYLDIRGALYDLSLFEDFGQVAARFPSGLFVPYTLEEGVYALPETINFWVLFYRTDILQALGIPVPDSLEDVKAILPELQRRNMNFYYPTAGMTGQKLFPATLPFILQAGGGLYGDTVEHTTLDSEASLRGFRELTELFTIYDLDTDVPSPGFYQQFRDGTLPLGVADLSTYNLLLNAAPELSGLWSLAPFPGLVNDQGQVERWTTGGAETCGLFSSTDRAEDGWMFLKWWTSADVQAEFGVMMQTTYGGEYIWPSANTEAFARLPLQAAHKAVILEQTRWMTEAPWVLGTYMVERELSNAYISVVVDGMDARRALDTAVKRIDRETRRKLEEFGYAKDGVTLRPFVTPSADVVERCIEAWRRSQEEGVSP